MHCFHMARDRDQLWAELLGPIKFCAILQWFSNWRLTTRALPHGLKPSCYFQNALQS
jgi:hypothetical protein